MKSQKMRNNIDGKDIKYREEILSENNIRFIKNFDCGNNNINNFLKCEAINYSESGLSKPYIFIDDNHEVLGFFTIKCSAIQYMLSEIASMYLPSIEIEYFAIDISLHKLKYDSEDTLEDGIYNFSDDLLCTILSKCKDISDVIGARFITLYSVLDAIEFYQRNGFKKFEEDMNEYKNSNVEDCVALYLEL